jgi:hypothetical protein
MYKIQLVALQPSNTVSHGIYGMREASSKYWCMSISLTTARH